MTTQSSTVVNDLFETALQEGSLSPMSMQALVVEDLGAKIQAALGVPFDSVLASEVVLVTQEIDDSGSIAAANCVQSMIDGHNLVYDALNASKQGHGMLAHTRYLNGHILFPYNFISNAVRMDTSNYNPNLGTPLYDETVTLLGTVLAKAQEFRQNGVTARTITLITTDGEDMHSHRHGPTDVRHIVEDMLGMETHIIAAMGIGKKENVFKQVFTEMGIKPEWILTPANSPSEIRKAFMLVSRSAVRASQNAGSFSKTAIGGFAN